METVLTTARAHHPLHSERQSRGTANLPQAMAAGHNGWISTAAVGGVCPKSGRMLVAPLMWSVH